MFGFAALSLSVFSLFLPVVKSLLLIISAAMAALMQRGLKIAGLIMTFNFLHLVAFDDSQFSNDWMRSLLGVHVSVVFIMQLFVQMLCLGVFIWRCAFSDDDFLCEV